LVLLDLMLPEVSGWDVFSALRRKTECPVIMLTARAEEADRVSGLEMGADDYVTKPFSMRELVARVRTVLRRVERSREQPESDAIEAGGVRLDPGRRQVLVDGTEVELSKTEFEVLAYLMRHAGRVRTRDDILRAVWGDSDYTTDRTVDVHVHWLRRKIEADPAKPYRVISVRGVGYKFAEDDGP
jgi:two-component system OmpR family response regulator